MLPGFISCFSPPLNSQHLEQFSGFFGGSDRKESTCSAGDLDSVPGGGKVSWRMEFSALGLLRVRTKSLQSCLTLCDPMATLKNYMLNERRHVL